MADMSKENLESLVAHYIREHLSELQFTGSLMGKVIVDIGDVNVKIWRHYDGAGRYEFHGNAYFYSELENGKAGNNYIIEGVADVSEGEDNPEVIIVDTISTRSYSAL